MFEFSLSVCLMCVYIVTWGFQFLSSTLPSYSNHFPCIILVKCLCLRLVKVFNYFQHSTKMCTTNRSWCTDPLSHSKTSYPLAGKHWNRCLALASYIWHAQICLVFSFISWWVGFFCRLLVIFCIINMLNYVDRGAIASNGVNGSHRTCINGTCSSGTGIQ